MSSRRRQSKRNAFTLIELLLVLVILAVLASIVVMNFGSVFGQSDKAKAQTDISVLDQAIDAYRIQLKEFPPTLDALVNNPGNPDWKESFIKKGLPVDPWGHPYNYQMPGSHNQNGYDLWSNGDGKTAPVGLDNWTAPDAKK